MANSTVANLQVSRSAVTGAIFWLPTDAVLPTDATSALPTGAVNLGHVGADGISTGREVSNDDVTDMNGDLLLRIQTGFTKSYSAPMLEVLNVALNEAVYGADNVTATPATSTTGGRTAIIDRGLQSEVGVLVIETRGLGNRGRERRVCPVAQITSASEATLVGSQVQQYELEWSLYKSNDGVYEYRYTDNETFTA